jgi:flagellar P-ring protein precursor FlgI
MRKHVCISAWIACSLATGVAGAARLKDLVTIEGVRENQLIGYGVVVGLAGTGDTQQTTFSNQSLTNILERMGVAVSPTAIRVKNTAAVMVTATLPAFAQPGMRIDITAGAIGDALNLQGGILVLTSLRGADGQVYAVAQGPVVTGGFAAGRGEARIARAELREPRRLGALAHFSALGRGSAGAPAVELAGSRRTPVPARMNLRGPRGVSFAGRGSAAN